MPRAERLEYENAYYHVMNRGRGRRDIYHGKPYYEAFLNCLKEAHTRFGMEVHAYCLMGNHYHLLVKTPLGNIGRCMRHVNGVYTQRYNRLKKTDGSLFRGRYKAILIERDTYLATLTRYIHRNPIETKKPLVDNLSLYVWSSYSSYINKKQAPDWLYREETYALLGYQQRYVGYKSFVGLGVDEEVDEIYSKKKLPSILGSKDFREGVYANEENKELVSFIKKQSVDAPGIGLIVTEVARLTKIESRSIYQGVRGRRQVARWMAMSLCQTVGRKTLNEIATAFNIKHISGVTHQVRQFKELTSKKGKFYNLNKLAIQYLTP